MADTPETAYSLPPHVAQEQDNATPSLQATVSEMDNASNLPTNQAIVLRPYYCLSDSGFTTITHLR